MLCRMPFVLLLLALTSALRAAPNAAPQAAPPVPDKVLPDNVPLIEPDPALFRMQGSAAGDAEVRTIDVQGQPFSKALRVEVKQRPKAEYEMQLAAPVAGPLRKGDVVLLTAWARTIESRDETAEGRLGLVLEQSKDPYDKALSRTFSVKHEWQRFDVPAKVHIDFTNKPPKVLVRVGYALQTLEIGGVTLRKFDPSVRLADLPQVASTYVGREPDAKWRAAAAERIERHRKAPLAVRVVDGAGAPLAGAGVSVRMRRNAFAFGSVYTPRRFGSDAASADDQTYRRTFLELFEIGVDEWAMKWPAWEDPKSRAMALQALDWMTAHGIPVRGHTMVWPAWKRLPDNVKSLQNDPPALRRRIEDHIRAVGAELAGRVVDWDVVNEPYSNNDLLKILGDQVMADWFRIAGGADPNARLYLNETGVPTSSPGSDRYDVLFNQVRMIQSAGAPIHGVGMQGHFGWNLQSPANLLEVFDRFATLGVPLRITELDIDVTDEQLQADYFRDLLTACYSHPNVNGVLIWGFWEGQHWRPNAAMFRKDWSERPIARVWRDLVLKQWRTNADGQTGADGEFQVRGFLGDYEVAVSANGKTAVVPVKLTQDAGVLTIELK